MRWTLVTLGAVVLGAAVFYIGRMRAPEHDRGAPESAPGPPGQEIESAPSTNRPPSRSRPSVQSVPGSGREDRPAGRDDALPGAAAASVGPVAVPVSPIAGANDERVPAPDATPADLARMATLAQEWRTELADDPLSARWVADEIRAALSSNDFYSMRAALAVLYDENGALETEQFREQLSVLLAHIEGGTRVRAATLLGRIGAADADFDVVARQAEATDWKELVVVPMLLARLMPHDLDGRADPVLERLLHAERPEVVISVLQALRTERIGPRSAQAIVECVHERGGPIELNCMYELQHKPRPLVDALLTAAESDDGRRAGDALRGLHEGIDVTDAARVVARLFGILARSQHQRVRVAAIECIGKLAAESDLGELRRIAGSGTESEAVRSAARTALDGR